MMEAAAALDVERAARIRDEMAALRDGRSRDEWIRRAIVEALEPRPPSARR